MQQPKGTASRRTKNGTQGIGRAAPRNKRILPAATIPEHSSASPPSPPVAALTVSPVSPGDGGGYAGGWGQDFKTNHWANYLTGSIEGP